MLPLALVHPLCDRYVTKASWVYANALIIRLSLMWLKDVFHIFGAIFGSFYTFSDIQMNSTIDLVALLERVPNATITVQLSDLNAFARRFITDTRGRIWAGDIR